MVSAQRFEQVGTESKYQSSERTGTATTALSAAEAGLKQAADTLVQQNDGVIQGAAYFVAEVGELELLQHHACDSVANKLETSLSPEVLDILKGNADQLFQLKHKVVADKQAAKDTVNKKMFWMSGSAGGQEQKSSGANGAGQLPASDAVKQRGFRPLQLPGSSLAANQSQPSRSPWQALRFWQVGAQDSKQLPTRAAAADTPGVADQQPHMQKSLSSMLFGKQKRHSSGGADAAARRLSIDPAASWRSSVDGSLNGRRTSARSSDAGAAMVAAASAAAAAAAAGGAERGAVMSSLASGEGPLSKSHSMLATKPGTQQEQILGKSLEIVAEDEREGRDSPAPAEPPGRRLNSVGQQLGLAPIRVPRGSHGLVNRPGSPVDSFSFGPRQEEEQAQSPSFLRTSVSSRMHSLAQQSNVAGPLMRSSTALRASMVARVDPFEAPEPEPQPFVEQLRAEQQESAAAAGPQSGIMAALRRSISGAGSNSRRTPRQSVEGAAWASTQLAPRQSQHIAYLQQQQQQQQPEGSANMQFLDLDATRAYALGVHQVMMRLEQGMQSLHSQSEASSKPASPRTSCFAEAAAAAAAAAEIAAAAGEVEAVDEQVDEDQLPSAQPSQQQLDAEDSDDADRPQQQQFYPARESGTDSGPLSVGRTRADISDAAIVPPLRSGMSTPAASRRQTLVTGARAAARQLPLMGQASMEILGKQHQQGLTASRQTSLVGASTAVSLAEVYKQTSGNLAPLSSHLSGVGRRSSSNANRTLSGPQSGLPSRAASGALAVSTSRSILGEAGPQAGALTSAGMGPLSMQYGSTMQQAKKSAHAAGLAAGAPDQHQMPAGWSSAPAAAVGPDGAGMDPAAFAANNKYASSWGILDAGGLSRQSSMNGAQMSRMPSGVPGSGSGRASPRMSGTDDGTWQQPQQRLRGAAGRYAGTSLTPRSQSPMSGTATPAREDSSMGMGISGQQSSAGRRRGTAGAPGRQTEQATAGRGAQGRDGSTVGSDDYESAEEQLSSGPSGLSGLSGPYGSAGGGVGTGRTPSVAGSSGLPHPPAFLSGRPTSAQAAVATQWSPSKNAAAFAQAPAYMRDAVLRISPEVSGTSMGLAPQGLQANSSRGVSPREDNTGATMSQSVNGPARVSSSSIGASRTSHTSAYEGGGYNIYAPLDPPMARSQSGRQQQQQPVVTAVDLARRQSMIRRASSQGGDYITGLSSNGRTSSSNIGYTQSSFQTGSGGYGTVGGRPQQQQPQQPQRQQQWGQQGSDQSGGIYGTIRPQQWQQRQQYRL